MIVVKELIYLSHNLKQIEFGEKWTYFELSRIWDFGSEIESCFNRKKKLKSIFLFINSYRNTN